MKINDVKVEAKSCVSGDVDILCVSPNGSRFIVGRLSLNFDLPQSKEARLNRRQLRIVAEGMCDAFNANQTYKPLENEEKAKRSMRRAR